MQYILTEQEYNDLKAKQKLSLNLQTDKLQAVCTKIANEYPIKFWGREEASPWGCVFTETDWYCDQCPVQEICPNEFKEWSK